jgi:hypothetical protein
MKIKLILAFSVLLLGNICFGQLIDPLHSISRGKEIIQECIVCHSCEIGQIPTKENPCFQQCLRPLSAKDVTTYDIVIIDRLVEKYEPVIFAHNLHATMSAMSGGCNNCHHYSQSVDDIQSCGTSGCHFETNEVNLKMSKPSLKGAYHRQCMGCHREWSHDTACGYCHAELSDGQSKIAAMDRSDIVGTLHPKIEAEPVYNYNTTYKDGKVVTFHHTDHVDIFGLKCTDCHVGDNCFRCHDTEKQKRKTFKHIETCGKCHVENQCNFCHSNKEKPPFEHDISTGFSLERYHTKVNCNKCHQSESNFVTPSTKCTDCHIHWDTGVFDHSVTGLTLNEDHEEEDCEVCHIDRDFSVNPTCDNCHDDISYPDDIPGERF